MLAVLAMLCTYYTYRNLPIAFATSIGMTSAIFTTALSGLILKEVIGYKKWGLVILGYIGALIVIKPTSFILGHGCNYCAPCKPTSRDMYNHYKNTI